MSAFDKEMITNYVDQGVDIIKKLKYQKSNDFMRVEGVCQTEENENKDEQSDEDKKPKQS